MTEVYEMINPLVIAANKRDIVWKNLSTVEWIDKRKEDTPNFEDRMYELIIRTKGATPQYAHSVVLLFDGCTMGLLPTQFVDPLYICICYDFAFIFEWLITSSDASEIYKQQIIVGDKEGDLCALAIKYGSVKVLKLLYDFGAQFGVVGDAVHPRAQDFLAVYEAIWRFQTKK